MSDAPVRILVVDDDPTFRNVLEMRLEGWGFEVRVASDAERAQNLAESWNPELVLSDVVMPEVSGIELLKRLRRDRPDRPVLLLTAHGSVELAVDAMKLGAVDFLTKPLNYRNLRAVIRSVLDDPTTPPPPSPLTVDRVAAAASPAKAKVAATPAETPAGGDFGPFVAQSASMREFYDLLKSVATTDASVLITGESGTGKELAARTVHEMSARSKGPFVALNTAAIPSELMESELFGHEKGSFTGATNSREGCFEMSSEGTLFLDEIGEMPMSLQPKLLRVLDGASFRRVGGKREFSFDVRTLAATNRDPRQAVEEGRLREDLYYRLNVLNLAIPPLRDREGDVSHLARHFATTISARHGVDPRTFGDEALDRLEAYAWPGNVRELRNVVERAVVLAREGRIGVEHLPTYIREPERALEGSYRFPPEATAEEAEKELILQTLDATGNNKSETARRLGLSVRTIRNKLKAYGIDR